MAFWKERARRPIALVGMMGAGKTSVGRLLAVRLGLPFRDTDEAVEAASGRTIAQIFAQEGEAAFRARERDAVAALLGGPPAVIATGGGAVLDAGTRALLKERAWTIWLKAEPAMLAARLDGNADRPLLAGRDRGEELTRLAAQREPLYAAADLHLRVDGLSPQQVADAILAAGDRAGGDESG